MWLSELTRAEAEAVGQLEQARASRTAAETAARRAERERDRLKGVLAELQRAKQLRSAVEVPAAAALIAEPVPCAVVDAAPPPTATSVALRPTAAVAPPPVAVAAPPPAAVAMPPPAAVAIAAESVTPCQAAGCAVAGPSAALPARTELAPPAWSLPTAVPSRPALLPSRPAAGSFAPPPPPPPLPQPTLTGRTGRAPACPPAPAPVAPPIPMAPPLAPLANPTLQPGPRPLAPLPFARQATSHERAGGGKGPASAQQSGAPGGGVELWSELTSGRGAETPLLGPPPAGMTEEQARRATASLAAALERKRQREAACGAGRHGDE